jgi:hypothetical protein
MDNRPMHHGMADHESCAIDPNSIRVFGRKLARTERLSGKELRAYQAPVLARLLAHARQQPEIHHHEEFQPDKSRRLCDTRHSRSALRGNVTDFLRAVRVGDFGAEDGTAQVAGVLIDHGAE